MLADIPLGRTPMLVMDLLAIYYDENGALQQVQEGALEDVLGC